jgi:hypothetical protein
MPSGPVFPPAGALPIGRYDFSEDGADFSMAISESGWISTGFHAQPQAGDLSKGPPSTSASAWLVVWGIDGAYTDPCGGQPGPVAGPSTSDLAAAVAAIPGIVALGPTDVIVGDHPAKHLVITIPEVVGCDPESFLLWYSDIQCGTYDPCGRYASAPGSTIRIWIVDVDGARVWLEAETYEGADAALDAEIQAMIDSIEFK